MTPKLSSGVSLLWLPSLPPGTFALNDDFVYFWRGGLFRHRRGGYTDGVSDQALAHAVQFFSVGHGGEDELSELLDPWGWSAVCGVPHDGGYHGAIDMWTGTDWKPFPVSKDDADTMFSDLLVAQAGVDEKKQQIAKLFYEGVHLFGQKAYDEGQSKPATIELP